MKKMLWSVSALTAVHFVVSKAIVAIAMRIDIFATDTGWAAAALGHVLIALTRVLYFPIITLSLYSRQWFPGNWIYIPMGVNSLLWGAAAAAVFWWWRRRSKTG